MSVGTYKKDNDRLHRRDFSRPDLFQRTKKQGDVRESRGSRVGVRRGEKFQRKTRHFVHVPQARGRRATMTLREMISLTKIQLRFLETMKVLCIMRVHIRSMEVFIVWPNHRTKVSLTKYLSADRCIWTKSLAQGISTLKAMMSSFSQSKILLKLRTRRMYH